MAFYSYFSADLQYSVMHLCSRHLLHPHRGSPAIMSHPLGPGCMMRSEEERESPPPMEGGTSTSSWDHVTVEVMIVSVLQDESSDCVWWTLTFPFGRKGSFLQLLEDCLQVGSALSPLWGVVSGEESHLARGHTPHHGLTNACDILQDPLASAWQPHFSLCPVLLARRPFHRCCPENSP